MVLKQYSQLTHDDSKHKTSAKRNTASGVAGLDASKEVINDVPVSKLVDMSEQSFENLIENGDFKLWPAGGSSAPGGWTNVSLPAVERETTIIKIGSNSVKLTPNATSDKLAQNINNPERYRSKEITFACFVHSAAADNAGIRIDDNVSGSESVRHSGGGSWEILIVTHTVDSAATSIQVRLYPDLANGNDFAYFSGCVAVEGVICPAFSPKPLTDTATYGEMYIHNNSNATVIETADTPIAIRQISGGLTNGFIFHAGSTGGVIGYSDYSGTVAGTIRVVCSGTHSLTTGDIITIRGTTNYNGIFAVTVITTDTFYITDTWVNDNGASDWDKGSSLTAQAGAAGVYTATWQMTASPAGACRVIFYINVNDTPQNKSGAPRELAINDEDNNSSTCLLQISDDDIIWLSVESDSTTDITHTYGNINIERFTE